MLDHDTVFHATLNSISGKLTSMRRRIDEIEDLIHKARAPRTKATDKKEERTRTEKGPTFFTEPPIIATKEFCPFCDDGRIASAFAYFTGKATFTRYVCARCEATWCCREGDTWYVSAV
jgi:hypothetical protein